ncbi:PhzF family phenazine biosynthesis protein [Rhodovibrionaceae bacterium A322]
MQRLPLYQVDAFTNELFGGNPAAVCPLDSWLPEAQLAAIAAENNLSETAYFVAKPDGSDGQPHYDLRWFTPAVEVDLCGHATLASASVIFTRLKPEATSITFHTRSGPLVVTRDGEGYALDFPARVADAWEDGGRIAEALGVVPLETHRAFKAMAVLADEAAVRAIEPDMDKVAALDSDGLIVTAPGDTVDFVSRYFAPGSGIPEDPVTGSAHCTSVPYWAERLGKTHLTARQISARGGDLVCDLNGERVRLWGQAVLYLEGTILLPQA